jgi:hypothetical protein
MQLLNVENLVFLIPLVFALLLVLAMAIGIPMGDHGTHVEVGHGGHFDHGFGHAGHGVGHDVGHGHAAGHDHGAHSASPSGFVSNVLSFFGIGRVPFAVTLVSAFVIWGVAGLALNSGGTFKHLSTTLLVATGAMLLGTRWISLGVSKLMPTVESYSVPAEELVSEQAEVVHELTSTGGLVRLTDRLGTLRDLTCRPGQSGGSIPRGSRVILTEYDEQAGTYIAEPV